MKSKLRTLRAGELRPEYDLAPILKKGVQGKYAKRYREGTNVVLSLPDVASAFSSDKAVNDALPRNSGAEAVIEDDEVEQC